MRDGPRKTKNLLERDERARRFVDEYPKDFNGTRAAIRSGYRVDTAGATACRLLKTPDILAALTERSRSRVEKHDVTVTRIVQELAKIGFANMMDYVTIDPLTGDPTVDLSGMTRDQAAAVLEVTIDFYVEGKGDDAQRVKRTRLKLADKRAALVDLGKHLGMFKEAQLPGVIVPAQLFDLSQLEKMDERQSQLLRELLAHRAGQPGGGSPGARPGGSGEEPGPIH